jgi:hypothetical protein
MPSFPCNRPHPDKCEVRISTISSFDVCKNVLEATLGYPTMRYLEDDYGTCLE